MDALRTLLSRAPGSYLALTARAQLVGLHSVLCELLAALPDDPGVEECRAVLREVESILAAGAAGLPAPAATMPRSDGKTVRGPSGTGAEVVPGTSTAAVLAAVPHPAPCATADDPAAVSAAAAVREAPVPTSLDRTPSAAGVHRPGSGADPELSALVGEFVASPEAVDYLGPVQLPSSADTPALWRWFHLAMLRLPTVHVPKWRERAGQLALADPAGAEWVEWRALDREQVLVPALPRYQSAGVRLGVRGEAAPWALEAADCEETPGTAPVGEGQPQLPVWVVLAGWVAGLGELDDQLHHCVESLTHRGTVSLRDPAHRLAYRQELAQRISRLAARRSQDSAAELHAALAVDEALCSVVHLPPAATGSWWAEVAEASQRAVLEVRRRARGRGADVAVEVLAPFYREARQRTGGNDIPLDAGGRKGQVLAGLRLWARIDGRELPGRVVYRG
ncbi:hypothetical protein [Streptomyces sp. S.PB5]|uniref:hypothetical protein n=1 Tax=Streptomyces sp. S.PB5 TaxID=3020844 RepID=UPI0025B1714B|nr:hypothetical protein [Streptomyces sp. S.PB5]MDN3025881.1 hypothetical protein [Streptomyces sp. S.PB5]